MHVLSRMFVSKILEFVSSVYRLLAAVDAGLPSQRHAVVSCTVLLPSKQRGFRPKATEGFGGGWMLAFCSRPKPLVMKNLTPYLYLTLGREGIGRTTLSNPLDLIICPDASRGDGEYANSLEPSG